MSTINTPIFKNNYVTITNKAITGITSVYDCIDNHNNKFHIINNPTGNCQVSSIAYCQNIVHTKEFVDILKSLSEIGYISRQLIIDIKDVSDWKEVIENNLEIVFKKEYKSTNNSEMVMYLVKLQDSDDEDDEDDDY